MSILANAQTRILIQGITGSAASHHTLNMLNYGTRIVAGARPGAAGQNIHGVPVFNNAFEAVSEKEIDAAMLFVPAAAMKQAAYEALDAGIKLIVMVSEHVPLHDTISIISRAGKRGANVVGPNTPGLISPKERCKLGFVPEKYFIPGGVGVASRSGTLTYEIVSRLTAEGIGQSTCIGVGGDPVIGTPFPVIARMFENDEDTDIILIVGEIGGSAEEETAEMVIRGEITKPVAAYIAGRTAPKDKRMGHAGAIIDGSRGTIESKLEAFAEAGIPVAETPGDVVRIVATLKRDGKILR